MHIKNLSKLVLYDRRKIKTILKFSFTPIMGAHYCLVPPGRIQRPYLIFQVSHNKNDMIKTLRNPSGNNFNKSKLLLLTCEKGPQGKLQFTSKNFILYSWTVKAGYCMLSVASNIHPHTRKTISYSMNTPSLRTIRCSRTWDRIIFFSVNRGLLCFLFFFIVVRIPGNGFE